MDQCKQCSAIIIGEDSSRRIPCEYCGSLTRIYSEHIEDGLLLNDLLGYKIKSSKLTGKKKVKAEQIDQLEDTRIENVESVRHIRLIDRENDHYYECVINWKTKEIIHEDESSLHDHYGHGSAKKD